MFRTREDVVRAAGKMTLDQIEKSFERCSKACMDEATTREVARALGWGEDLERVKKACLEAMLILNQEKAKRRR